MSSVLLAVAAAAASQVPATTADQALANEKAAVSIAPPPKRTIDCSHATPGEIVVCRKREVDPATQYVPSDVDNGVPTDDIPRAPPVTMLPSCAAAMVCAQHLGKMPVHPLIIDVKAIPEPPAGSDADRMAKGEMAVP